jgi:hypothetical protein
MPFGSYRSYTLGVEDSMNDKMHEPVYRAAADAAHAELGEISEMIDQLRARQGQIFAAVEALEQVVNSATSRPVYEMTPRNSQSTQNSQRIVDAKVLNPLEAHIQDALRAATA